MSTTAEKIAVMQAAERGEKIEYSPKAGCNMGRWFQFEEPEGPGWNFNYYNYRVAPRELKIWVCEWVTQPGRVWVTENNPKTWLDATAFRVLSEQTIKY